MKILRTVFLRDAVIYDTEKKINDSGYLLHLSTENQQKMYSTRKCLSV